MSGDGIADIAFVGRSDVDVEIVLGATTFDPANSEDAITIKGFRQGDKPGWGLRAMGPGDVNGDGVDDLVIGNPDYLPTGGQNVVGEMYVLFGGDKLVSDVGDISAETGFGFIGYDTEFSGGDQLGFALSPLGDFNGDGVNDLFFRTEHENGDIRSYVMYGTQSVLPGDANGDGSTNFQDFLILANNFGKEDAAFAEGDFDGDGSVSFLDFLVLAQNFELART